MYCIYVYTYNYAHAYITIPQNKTHATEPQHKPIIVIITCLARGSPTGNPRQLYVTHQIGCIKCKQLTNYTEH